MTIDIDAAFGGTTLEIPLVFSPGQNRATVENSVVRGTRNRHLFQAHAGQHVSVHVRAAEQNVEFTIRGPRGERVASAEGQTSEWRWSGVLPTDGQYAINVYSQRGNASYTLTVTLREAERSQPQRIRFAPGTSSTVVHGQLGADGAADRYIFRARAGQWLLWKVDATARAERGAWEISSQLRLPDQTGTEQPFGTQAIADRDDQSTGVGLAWLPIDHDYWLSVTAMGDAPTPLPYNMMVGIETVPPQRVQFRPGTTSAQLYGTLDDSAIDVYVLRASSGQRMTLAASPATAGLMVNVVGPDDYQIHSFSHRVSPQLERGVDVQLEASGDYLVAIASPANAVSYSLTVGIGHPD